MESALLSAALGTNMQPEDEDGQETGNNEVWRTLPQRSDCLQHSFFSVYFSRLLDKQIQSVAN